MRNGDASIHINVDPSSLAEQYLQWGNKILLKSLPMPSSVICFGIASEILSKKQIVQLE
jgi:hypothetical protein